MTTMMGRCARILPLLVALGAVLIAFGVCLVFMYTNPLAPEGAGKGEEEDCVGGAVKSLLLGFSLFFFGFSVWESTLFVFLEMRKQATQRHHQLLTMRACFLLLALLLSGICLWQTYVVVEDHPDLGCLNLMLGFLCLGAGMVFALLLMWLIQRHKGLNSSAPSRKAREQRAAKSSSWERG